MNPFISSLAICELGGRQLLLGVLIGVRDDIVDPGSLKNREKQSSGLEQDG